MLIRISFYHEIIGFEVLFLFSLLTLMDPKLCFARMNLRDARSTRELPSEVFQKVPSYLVFLIQQNIWADVFSRSLAGGRRKQLLLTLKCIVFYLSASSLTFCSVYHKWKWRHSPAPTRWKTLST